ncbi:MAG: cell envelope integrity EipB family protein [Alphaproteobacteria bacterium]|nr:cell envelope integrity EipB family protein [Alphaproteobacteria bacterium]
MRHFFKNIFLLSYLFIAFPALATPLSHTAKYDISLLSTEGGAQSVVGANGILKYQIRKACSYWQTETIFSLDINYDISGIETTNWKQETTESLDGCVFDFKVFTRDKSTDHSDLQGQIRCDGKKQKIYVSHPFKEDHVLNQTVKTPLQQMENLFTAAKAGKKHFSSIVYDGTQYNGIMFVSVFISENKKPARFNALKDKKSWHFDFAFYPLNDKTDVPAYETSAIYYENGVADEIIQDFGAYRLLSTLKELKPLRNLTCSGK